MYMTTYAKLRAMASTTNQRNKEVVWDLWQRLNHCAPEDADATLRSAMHSEIAWFGPHPINACRGVEEVGERYLGPLLDSFDGLRRTCDVFLGGESCGDGWVSACGYLTGTFVRDWLGIPATGRRTHIHFGEHCRLEEGRIVESYLILDVLSVIRQAGFQLLPPARGAEGGKVLPPPAGAGVLLTSQDPLETLRSRELVWAMIRALWRYDQLDLDRYWHPDVHWYGPTGIGSCFSLEQFREFHEGPWEAAFPDAGLDLGSGRLIGLQDGEILAEGNYAALGVWDTAFSVSRGTFLGIEPTGELVRMRDFDWYRRDGAKLVQNWVPIDIIDLVLQLGVDLMQKLADEREQREALA